MAQIYFDSLDDKLTVKAIRAALRDFQEQGGKSGQDKKVHILADAYGKAMERITAQKKGLRDLAIQVLSWITCAKRPLTTIELQHAIAVDLDEKELDETNLTDVDMMVSVCAGLVTVDEGSGVIRLVHHTAQEYFEKTQNLWFPEVHATITRICIAYLLFRDFGSGYSQTDEKFEHRLRSNPFYDYAAHNWGHHARTTSHCKENIIFLKNQAHVEASSQALLAIKTSSGDSNYSQRFTRHMTGLHLAAYFELQEAMEAMVGECDPDVADGNGWTPLLLGAKNGYKTVVRLLLERHVNIEAKDNDGWNSLLLAVRNGHETVARLLLGKGADIAVKDKGRGQTPLSLAAERGYGAVVQLLLDKGADIEARDKYYFQTPLSLAVENGHDVVVISLLDRNADIESQDTYGRTPLLWAADKKYEGLLRLLLDRGANTEAKDKYGWTPLQWTAEKGHETSMRLLLDRHANIEAKDKYGWTPLLLAAGRGKESIVRLLLERGANISAKDMDGRTPLQLATLRKKGAVVRLLSEWKDADIETLENSGGQ